MTEEELYIAIVETAALEIALTAFSFDVTRKAEVVAGMLRAAAFVAREVGMTGAQAVVAFGQALESLESK
jgi:phosphohistidine swiveling domain-containing protein